MAFRGFCIWTILYFEAFGKIKCNLYLNTFKMSLFVFTKYIKTLFASQPLYRGTGFMHQLFLQITAIADFEQR